MGITAALDPLLSELAKHAKLSGAVSTLGVMNVDGGVDAHTYFSNLGFSMLQAIDISDFEGADHIFDLNEDELPNHLSNRFEAVFNGGTLEHVFHVPNALTYSDSVVRPAARPSNPHFDQRRFIWNDAYSGEYRPVQDGDQIRRPVALFLRKADRLLQPYGRGDGGRLYR